jgi:hypothetical protein
MSLSRAWLAPGQVNEDRFMKTSRRFMKTSRRIGVPHPARAPARAAPDDLDRPEPGTCHPAGRAAPDDLDLG